MRLYLSSFRLGNHADQLLELMGPKSRIAVIANALDKAPVGVRRSGVNRELDDLSAIGLRAEEIDLRTPGSAAQLHNYPAVWVRGGNTFVLRQALADARAEQSLCDLIRSDTIVYAGYSAGPAVLAPSLRGIEQVDDVAEVTQPIWDGLGLIDRPLVPHVDSPTHPETASCDRLSAQLTRLGVRHWALRDGDALSTEEGRLSTSRPTTRRVSTPQAERRDRHSALFR